MPSQDMVEQTADYLIGDSLLADNLWQAVSSQTVALRQSHTTRQSPIADNLYCRDVSSQTFS
jgi:hypothetical protein